MPPSVPPRALLGLVVLGGILTASVLVSPAGTATVAESIADDPSLFALFVVGLYLVRPLFAWPTTPLAVVVGYGFGVWAGVPIALAGVLLSVTPVFFAARWFTDDHAGDSSATAWLPFADALEWTSDAVCRYYETAGPIRGVTASRLAPIPSDISTCAAAVSGVRYRHLLVGTAIGEFPWTVAAVVVGASTATITADGVGELGVTVVVACVLAAVVLLATPAYRLARARFTQIGY